MDRLQEICALTGGHDRTRFCDSAGLQALIGAHRRARAEGGEVRFVVTGPAVRRILAIMAIDRLIPVFDHLDEALAPPARSDQSRPASGQDIVGHVGGVGL
jgi:hypothetical protein